MFKRNYFWDSCVFIAYLNNDEASYDINSLHKFIQETIQASESAIYTSGIALAEVTPRRLKNGQYDRFQDFLNDFRRSVTVIDTGPYINIRAGLLKDIKYRKGGSNRRVLTTGDALMLATALELEEVFGIKIDAFHTFDNGFGKGNPEGRGVPLLSYEEWCEGVSDDPLVKRIIEMNRCIPIHETPSLL